MEADRQTGIFDANKRVCKDGSGSCLYDVLKQPRPVEFYRFISSGSRGIEFAILLIGIEVSDG